MFKTPKRLVFRIIVELDEAEWQDAEAPSSAARPQGPDTPQQKEAGQPGLVPLQHVVGTRLAERSRLLLPPGQFLSGFRFAVPTRKRPGEWKESPYESSESPQQCNPTRSKFNQPIAFATRVDSCATHPGLLCAFARGASRKPAPRRRLPERQHC